MLAVVLIIAATFAGTLLVSMLVGKTKARKNNQQSNAALYIAISGLEVAKHDITAKHMPCAEYINNTTQFDGTFTVKGKPNSTIATLLGEIDDANLKIALSDVSKFAKDGIIAIDNELITYVGTDGNTLLNITRGALGTIKTDHKSDTPVVQNQCELTATGNVTLPDAKRTIKQPLLGFVGFSYNDTTNSTIFPAIISTGTVTLPGSKDGVVENYNGSPALFEYFFNTSKEGVQTDVSVSNKNKVSWTNEINMSNTEDATIGTIDNPKILVVSNKVTLADNSKLTVNGILYVMGPINVDKNASITVNGQIAAENNINIQGSIVMGNKKGVLNPNISTLSALGIIEKNTIINNRYKGRMAGILQEVFS